jgi:hypothetical protein
VGAPAAGDPLGRGAGRLDGLHLGVAGRALGRLGRRDAPLRRFDLCHHLAGLLPGGTAQRRQLGGLLGVPAAGLAFGLRAGALLVGGLLQPFPGGRDGVALLRLLAPSARQAGGRGLEPPGGGLHLVGLVRIDGVPEGGTAQRPLGDGAGGQ